jgi:hypothetical protein
MNYSDILNSAVFLFREGTLVEIVLADSKYAGGS